MKKGTTIILARPLQDMRGFYKAGTEATIESVRKDSLSRDCYFVKFLDNSEHLLFADEIAEHGEKNAN